LRPLLWAATRASVYYVDQFIPKYFEMSATIRAVKPTAGFNANSYLIFDYQSPTDFKFAGINVSTNKLEMGHRTATVGSLTNRLRFPQRSSRTPITAFSCR